MAREKRDILSASSYDADAASIHTTSDNASDSEDDQAHNNTQATFSANEHDRSILREEEETEQLLSKPTRFDAVQGMFNSNPHEGRPIKTSKRAARREKRRQKRSSRKGGSLDGTRGELMYEMEEGWKDTSRETSADSSSTELDKVWQRRHERQAGPLSRRRLLFFHMIAILLFCALAYGAYHASAKFRKVRTSFTLSNGTHLFAPTTILISLDGFRADFLNRNLTPTLNEFISQGVSPRYMLPSFPSVTFPNHFTLVTGLYPESHGVVGNTFWDPQLQDEFHYTNTSSSMQPKWWNAEPLWVTAEQQGIRTAIHMWPGSEAHIPPIEPTYIDKFNGNEALDRKVTRILNLLDLPGDADQSAGPDLRPQLIAAYVPNVDADGHKYGPNSTEIRTTISRVDSMLADLFHGLYNRNLTSIINIVVVSDHGMATTSNERLIQLDDLVDLDLVDHVDGWPLRGLRLKNPDRDVQPMYERLLTESAKSNNFEVYTRETMPERYHFSNNERIAPLWVVPKTGWAVVEKSDFDIVQAQADGQVYRPKGLHGYDHEHPLMRAIAIMRGPSFPHEPNSRVEIFQNTEIYNIVCDSLGLEPHPNNGTLRLPLKTIGFHDSDVPDAEDPVSPSLPVANPDKSASTGMEAGDNPDSAFNDSSDVSEGSGSETDDQKADWMDFFKDRLEAAKEWANAALENLKNIGWHKPETEEGSKT